MKVAVIARGRTNSTAIAKTLANKYELTYVGEEYFWIHEELSRWLQLRPHYDKNQSFIEFEKRLQLKTESIFLNQNFIVKLFPSILHFPPSLMYEGHSFKQVKDNFIFNLNILNLLQYDKFYFLDRNFYSSIISWIYAYKSYTFHNHKMNKRKYLKVSVGKDEFARAKFYMIEYFLQQKILQYLTKNKISYTYINEFTCDQFINNDYLSTDKTPINYKDYIINITELNDFINYWYPIIEQETSDWHFY